MKAAALRHRVSLQSSEDSADGGGGSTTVWSEVATLWASIEPLKGVERVAAQQIETRLTHRVRLRHRLGVTTAMRIQFGSRIFNIHAVINPQERNRLLELLCEEGVAT